MKPAVEHDVAANPRGYLRPPHCVSVEIISAAMMSEYRISDCVLIDLNLAPASGDAVLVEVGGHVLLRRYWLNADGTLKLLADNRDHPAIASDPAAAMVLGVAIERRRFRQTSLCGRALPGDRLDQ